MVSRRSLCGFRISYTLLHAQIAEGIKFEYRMGNCQYLQVGDGSFIPVFLHDLQIQLGRELITASVGFSDKLGIGFNLLGRAGIFDRYRICFQENKRILSFES